MARRPSTGRIGEGAIARFEEMLRLADDPDVKDEPSISELRLLGAGVSRFEPGACGAQAGGLPGADRAGGCACGRARRADADGYATGPDPRGLARSGTRGCREPLRGVPRHDPRAASTRTGRVTEAEMTAPVHPMYDPPAPSGGAGLGVSAGADERRRVPSEKVVEVVLKPR